MPIHLITKHLSNDHELREEWTFKGSSSDFPYQPDEPERCLTIGLVNNMGDSALEPTEQQFLRLLHAASHGLRIRLALFCLPGLPRKELAARHIAKFYTSTEAFQEIQLDGLIVTGREPSTPNLEEEPYWDSFTRTVDWARDNTYSTVWSCLAAHGAVLHLDGIRRLRNSVKHCGVFECEQLVAHELLANTPARYEVPHSRWNGMLENALTSSGYDVLSRTSAAGPDTFIKQFNSLFVFFQGHPEYDQNSLLLEYRRDLARYFKGECEAFPRLPSRYLEAGAVEMLAALERKADSSPQDQIATEIAAILSKAKIEKTWEPTAVRIYTNWMKYLCAQKELQSRPGRMVPAERMGIGPALAANSAVNAGLQVVP